MHRSSRFSPLATCAFLISCGDSHDTPAPTNDVAEAPPPITITDPQGPLSPYSIHCADLSRTDIAALFRKPVFIQGNGSTCYLQTGLGGDVRITLDGFGEDWKTLTRRATPYAARDKALYVANEYESTLFATRGGFVCSATVKGWNDPTLASQYSRLRGNPAIARLSALCEQVLDHLEHRVGLSRNSHRAG